MRAEDPDLTERFARLTCSLSLASILSRVNVEAEARQRVVAEWRAVFPGADLNDAKFDPLIKAIELWGEHLVALRAAQDQEVVDRALHDKLVAYERVRS